LAPASRALHAGVQKLVQDLNRLHKGEAALHERDTDGGFSFIEADDHEQSVIVFARMAKDPKNQIVAAFNFTPVHVTTIASASTTAASERSAQQRRVSLRRQRRRQTWGPSRRKPTAHTVVRSRSS